MTTAERRRRIGRWAAGLALVAGLTLAVAGLRAGSDDAAAPAAAADTALRDVVIVTLDTLRADRVGAYGDRAGTTPHLDRLAREGARFTAAAAPVPLTLPSHATLFTGREPYSTGVRINGADLLPEDEVTLAERFADAGWATAAFVSAFPVVRRFGLAQGFDHYEDSLLANDALRFTDEVPGPEVVRRFADWLEETRPRRYFAWLHLYDPHRPWEPPEPFRSRFPDDPYRGEVALADHAVGELRAALDAAGRLDGTLLIVTSDHGEGLGEHGEEGHGIFAYEEMLRVPLLVRLPGVVPAGTVVQGRVGLVDVAPTVLELAGLSAGDAQAAMDGRSLVAGLRGRGLAPRDAYFESLLGAEARGWAPLRGLVRGDTKLVHLPEPELYDLERDPGETTNLYGRERRRARELEAALAALASDETAGAAADRDLSAEERRRLAALGYATPAGGSRTTGTGLDPKVAMPLHGRLSLAEAEARAGDAARAGETLAAAEEDPRARELPSYYYARHQLALARGDVAGAAEALAEGLRRFPHLEQMRYQRAVVLLQSGRLDLAEEESRELLRRQPTYAEAWDLLSRAALARGDVDAARRAMERALELDPSHRGLRLRAVPLRVSTGDLEGAAELLRGLDRDGALGAPDPLFQAALLHAQLGDAATAEHFFHRGLERRREPRDRLAWAAFLLQRGRREEARAELQSLRSLALGPPESAMLQQLLGRVGSEESTGGGDGLELP